MAGLYSHIYAADQLSDASQLSGEKNVVTVKT